MQKLVRTTVSYVRKGSKSLKVIIPEGIVSIMKLSHGDTLEWEVEARGDQLIVLIKKVSN